MVTKSYLSDELFHKMILKKNINIFLVMIKPSSCVQSLTKYKDGLADKVKANLV